ncbi:MAG: peptidylprolyl isomerase [Anaerolineales bacterium]|nr:peptidylprolyl isomerase [Anaerolineales bacterium]
MRIQRQIVWVFLFTFLITSCNADAQVTVSPAPEAIIASPEPTPTIAAPTDASMGCSSIQAEPTPVSNFLFPSPTETDYSIGPSDASVTITEYCDFQSPICISMAAVVSNVYAKHPNEIRLVFRPVPLTGQLNKSELAIQAALAADEQKNFWNMYDVLFQKNAEWTSLSPNDFKTWVAKEASGLGLDGDKFRATMNSVETATRIKSMYEAARQSQLQAVPLILINGSPQPSFALDYPTMESTIALITLGKRQYTQCPPFTIDSKKQYIATLETEKGNIVINLFANKAPLAVNSFVFLAREGWFNGVTFHRVLPGFAAQAGDPSGTGRGGPGYFFKNEIDPSLKFDRPGVVGMANSGSDTNGSQFFITYAPAAHLDGVYTVFGQVLSGMDVLEKLTPRDPQKGNLPAGDKLLHVTIEEK